MKKLILFLTILFNFKLIGLELLAGDINSDKFEYKLIEAIKNGDCALASYLIPNVNLNIQDSDGNTPLIVAASKGQIHLIQLLIKKGVDLNTKNRHGATALMYAYDQHCLKLLIEAGANLDIQDNEGNTALMYATRNKYWYASPKIELLIIYGANTSIQDNEGNTFLHYINYHEEADLLYRDIQNIKNELKNHILNYISIKPLCDIIKNYLFEF